MKTRLHKKQQNCSKLLTFFTMSVALLSGVVAMGLCTIRETYHQARAVEYDDEGYTIILSAYELNNYQFYNFYNFLLDNSSYVSDIVFSYANLDTDIFFDDLSFSNINNSFRIDIYMNSAEPLYFLSLPRSSLNSDYRFLLYSYIDDEGISFDGDLSFYSNSSDESVYLSMKTVIEQDISANQPSPTQPMLDFISIIVSGIGAFASGVASGVSDFASALFLDIEGGQVVGLSVFGGILAIFSGLALAVGITIKVYNWITSLGN